MPEKEEVAKDEDKKNKSKDGEDEEGSINSD